MSLDTRPTWQKYDDEFRFADEFNPKLAAELAEYERREKHTHSSAQTQETYQELLESNTAARARHKFPQQEEFKAQREGRILHMNAFLGKLREAGLNAWFTDKGGMAKTLGLYVDVNGKPQYVCYVQVPFMQEYEELYFDRYDIPLGSKRRGWRTVLLNLIQKGLITEERAHQIFGEPASGVVSRRYREHLQFYRNQPK